ncbi:amidohydrolase [Corynebacterium sp. TA-R-1]|uniref:Amidohydrolase n=1 Tax=Corynebacterium stercoris TaxID=2943490 RepID=A0ABT1G168_9CORY|nr:amidohydrolase [Corynebacterium stercoris]MCP1387775.1 amidohydrolase [Corynebacterium stercoris]
MTNVNLDALRDGIDTAARDIRDDVIDWRHHLHKHPELPNREEQTAAFIVERLREFGIADITEGVAGHGVVARIRGDNGDEEGDRRTILLRADIDALPVKEQSGEDFASEVVDTEYPGGPFPVAHACGHDTHAAMLLGAAKILHDQRDQLRGDVLLAFQPAEEGAPAGEEGGASLMVEEMEAQGLFEPRPTMAFGIHISPLPVGAVAYARGIQNAASETVKITVVGKQVHGSTPWQGIDPMPAVGDILSNTGQIYRQIDVEERFSISLGHIVDQGRFNIVGEQVEIWGTVRALRSEVMADVNQRLERYVEHLAAAHGCTGTVEFFDEVPPVVNGPEWIDSILPVYERIAGEAPVIEVPSSMGYDDFSEFSSRFGGVYALLGGQNIAFTADGGIEPTGGDDRGFVPNHSPRFYVNDEALEYGVRLHAQVAVDHLFGELSGEPQEKLSGGAR